MRKIPLVTWYFLFGCVREVINTFAIDSDILGYKEVEISFLCFCLIPIMLAKDSLFMNTKLLFKSWKQILALVFFGFFISLMLIMVLMKFAFSWNWAQAGTFASMVSCTDPVAAVGILEFLGVDETLSMWIAGESLFNDGVAVPTFKNFALGLEEIVTPTDVLISILKVVVGGIILGIIFGCITILFYRIVPIKSRILYLLSCILTPNIIWYVAEGPLECSGILAVVTFGVFVAALRDVDEKVEEEAFFIMESFVHALEMIMFHWGGMYVANVSINVSASDWMKVPLVYFGIYIARIIAIIPAIFVLRMDPSFKWNWIGVCVHGALRGGLSLFLGLELQSHTRHHYDEKTHQFADQAAFHVAMFVFLTTLVNGPTLTSVCECLGIETSSNENSAENESIKTHHETQAI